MTPDATPEPPGITDATAEKIARRVAELLRSDLDTIAHQLTEIRRSDNLAQILVQAWQRETFTPEGLPAARPDSDTPRPPEIDWACARATEKQAPQRVDLFQFGMTQHIRPDSDPQHVWDGILAQLTAEEDESEISHSPRSRGR